MSEQSQIRLLVEAYIEDAKHHKGRDGKVRSQNTMSGYREAARRFADAVEAKGLPLDQLPPDFLHTDWLQLLQHRWHQPVQLRVRSYAVQGLIKWLHEHNVPIAPLIPVKVQTPDSRAGTESVDEPMDDVPPEESNMPQPILNDFSLPEDGLGGETQLPPMQQQMPMMAQPQMVPVQRQPPANIGMPVPARPAAPVANPGAPRMAVKANPLAHLLPTAGYRLRVRRERDLEEPVWVGDYPAEQVVVHGAIEPFLAKVAASKLPGVVGDVTFQVCPIGPDGREGDRSRVTIAVLGSPQPQTAAPPPTQPSAASSMTEIADLMSYHRRAQEELESRIADQVRQLQGQQQPQHMGQLGGFGNFAGFQPQQPSNMYAPPVPQAPQDPVHMALAEMQNGMRIMAERIAELSQPQQPVQPQPPHLDILAVIDRVGGMMRSAQPTEPPKSAAGSMGEVFSMMAQAKEIFAPSNVNVDVSPLEDELKSVRAELQAVRSQAQKKDEILEFAEKMKALQTLFGGAGPLGSSAGKPAGGGIGAALGGLIEKVVENPEPIANAVERVLNGIARVKESAVTQEIAKPPAPTPGQGLDPKVKAAIEALLSAQGDGAIVTTAMEMMRVLNASPGTKPVAEQIAKRLTGGNEVELVAFLRQVFTRLGYAAVATPDRLQVIVTAVFKQVRAAQQQEAEQLAAQQAPEGSAPEDEEDEESDEEDNDEEYDDSEDESAEPDELQMELDEQQRLKGSTLNIRVGGTREEEALLEEADAEEEQEEEEPEPPPPPRKRRGRQPKADPATATE